MAATWAGKIPVTQVNQTTKTFTASTSVPNGEESIRITTDPETAVQLLSIRIVMADGVPLSVKKGTIVRVVVQITE